VAIAAVITVVLLRHFETMPASAAAKALRLRLQTSYRFHCHRVHNDGTIPLANVTYLCDPVGHPELVSWWISTDRHRITGMEHTG